MCKHELLAIFCRWCFGGGLKSLLFIYFTGTNGEEGGRGSWWLGHSKFQRLFFCFTSLILVLCYIICFLFYIQNAQIAQLARLPFGKRWDLGSIPRSPHNSHIIFHLTFLCSAPRKVHHRPHRSNKPGVFKAYPKATKEAYHMLQSMDAHASRKSQRGLASMGLNSSISPPFLAQHPLQLVHFSFHFIFQFNF